MPHHRWRSCIERTRVASAAPCSSYLTSLSAAVITLLPPPLASLSAAACSVFGIWSLQAPLSIVKPRGPTELPKGERREDVGHRFVPRHLP